MNRTDRFEYPFFWSLYRLIWGVASGKCWSGFRWFRAKITLEMQRLRSCSRNHFRLLHSFPGPLSFFLTSQPPDLECLSYFSSAGAPTLALSPGYQHSLWDFKNLTSLINTGNLFFVKTDLGFGDTPFVHCPLFRTATLFYLFILYFFFSLWPPQQYSGIIPGIESMCKASALTAFLSLWPC